VRHDRERRACKEPCAISASVYGVVNMSSVPVSKHIRWDVGQVTRAQREAVRGQRGVALWLTGLSGSGKSTLARAVESALCARGIAPYVLDGDNLRHGLCSDLGFSPEARRENVRRVGEVAKLFVDAGVLVLCAFVSPYRADRDRLRTTMAPGDFVEVFVKASLGGKPILSMPACPPASPREASFSAAALRFRQTRGSRNQREPR